MSDEAKIIYGQPYGKRLPFFRSQITSDSPRIRAAIDEAEPGDIIYFEGIFFCDEPIEWGGYAVTYIGNPQALMYFLPAKQPYPYYTTFKESAHDLMVSRFTWAHVPPNWIVKLFRWMFRRKNAVKVGMMFTG